MNWLPIFPLSLVAYPTAPLNLHIFEKRYQQLVKDCMERNIPFGIPPHQDGKQMSICTVMKIASIEKTYEGGKMDIKTYGVGVCTISEIQNPYSHKLYAAAQIEEMPYDLDGDPLKAKHIISLIDRLYQMMNIQKSLPNPEGFTVYSIASKAGMSLAQEIELLKIPSEKDRQDYVLRHLRKMIPMVEEMENMRRKVQMNGHFKNVISPEW